MGLDHWCSRSLSLFVALACAPGCGQVAEPPDVIPNATANANSPSQAVPVPAALAPTVPTTAALAREFLDDAPQQPMCGDPLLGADFSLDDAGLPTLYVDAASGAAAPDGSLVAPFRTLRDALVASSSAAPSAAQTLAPQRRVLVASGHYDEDVAIPPGTLLFGGYDAQLWEPGANPSVIGGSVYLGTAMAPAGIVSPEGYVVTDSTPASTPSVAPLTALRSFEVNGGVAVVSGARALLRNNVIAPVFFSTTGDPSSRAMAVLVNAATVRADRNRLVVPASDPGFINSSGFFTWNSCAWVSENEITDYRSPISLNGGLAAAATFNVLQRAENGIGVSANQALIAANSIHTYMPLGGCVYAVIMSADAHPDIRDNTIYLSDVGNRGIVETDTLSRPTALLRNRFYSPQVSPALYIDHRGAVDPQLIFAAGSLNALSGIATAGGNTFERVTAAP